MAEKFHRTRVLPGRLIVGALVCFLLISPASRNWAVTSKITRHAGRDDLQKGEAKDVVIDSRGTLQLGRAAEVLVKEFKDVWSINSIVAAAETVYLGTSPNGGIYRYGSGKLTKIYPPESQIKPAQQAAAEPNDPNKPPGETVATERHLSNEHIFAMAMDAAGRLLAGISGEKCKLCRFQAEQMETIFEPNDAKYIFAIVTDSTGNIFLGTGPQGKVYQLDPQGREAKLLYDCLDNNILSLSVGPDGFVYAGSDERGLVYKIDPRTKTATVLYDSDQPEVTALLLASGLISGQGDLYAAATSARIVDSAERFASQLPMAGRPEVPSQKPESASDGGRKLQIANTKRGDDAASAARPAPVAKPARPSQASCVYKITKDGFVTDIFSETAVLFCLAEQDGKLLVGAGNDGQLFAVDPVSEQQAIIYKDEQASQITAVVVAGNDLYLGTANPAKLIKLGKNFASEGTYTSDLIDTGQPAKWGKLQIEADMPRGCKVMVASRSGNVKDVNDPTFSNWTDLVEVTEPIQLRCPLGRFCQYKLVLQSEQGRTSPVIREIAVASAVPNLAPKIKSVSVNRVEAPGKTGVFKISYKAEDDNGDKLTYKIDFRKVGRTNWIELEDEIEKEDHEWDGKTVEDGRYEVRVTASDARSNTTTTKLTGSRISDPVVVDNTGPEIKTVEQKIDAENGKKFVTLRLQVSDQLSAIGQLQYTVDSNTEWKGTVPEDLVYDTTDEKFTIVIEDLKPGEHILAVKVQDDLGNTTYKTFEFNL
jgi:outer membrane protein assembly factor BamB